MNDVLGRRVAALTGLALAAAVALWWLGSSRLAIEDGADTDRAAADALLALWLARGMAVSLLSLRVGALHGWRPGAMAAMVLIAPSWPLMVAAWSASTMPFAQVMLTEMVLLAAGFVLPLVGLGLLKLLREAERAELVATAVGALMAASVWLTRGLWTLP